MIAVCCFLVDYHYKFFTVIKRYFIIPRTYIFQTVSLPMELFRDITKYFVWHNNLLQENIYLKQFNQLLSTKIQTFTALERENTRLKELLKFSEQQSQFLILAKVIDASPDLFTHQIILNKGLKHGVYVGQPIVNQDGILGSIITVENTTSIAMLITDMNYAVPVLNLRTGFRAIALGTGDYKELVLQHVPHTVDIKAQDVFVTSGIGGKYPAGYKVGTVKTVQHETNFPFANIVLEVTTQLNNCHEVLLIYPNKE
jgi:rod shape-determining protein MreC